MGDEEDEVHRPGGGAAARGGHRRGRARCRPTPCSIRAPGRATMRPCACTTTRRWCRSRRCDFDEAVNVTLGLPFVRTSPDHGTALDIAGQGRARPDSLIAAIELAAAMARRRREHMDDHPHRCGWASTSTMSRPCATRGAGCIPTRSASPIWRVEAGADSITVHLREDRRHIRDGDVERLMAELAAPLNLEMAVTAGDGGDRAPAAAARHLPGAREAAPR